MRQYSEDRHPLWERSVHPWRKGEWSVFTTLNERSERIVLCWHCGQEWPCHEAMIQQVEAPKYDHGAP